MRRTILASAALFIVIAGNVPIAQAGPCILPQCVVFDFSPLPAGPIVYHADAKGARTCTSFAAGIGETVDLLVSGAFFFWWPGELYMADAEYNTAAPLWVDLEPHANPATFGFVVAHKGQPSFFDPGDPAFEASHTYAYSVVGQGYPLCFGIVDGVAGSPYAFSSDNEGGVFVEVML